MDVLASLLMEFMRAMFASAGTAAGAHIVDAVVRELGGPQEQQVVQAVMQGTASPAQERFLHNRLALELSNKPQLAQQVETTIRREQTATFPLTSAEIYAKQQQKCPIQGESLFRPFYFLGDQRFSGWTFVRYKSDNTVTLYKFQLIDFSNPQSADPAYVARNLHAQCLKNHAWWVLDVPR